jgi:hypothetical protein
MGFLYEYKRKNTPGIETPPFGISKSARMG